MPAIVNNPEWRYCMIIPTGIRGIDGNGNGSQTGLGPENDLTTGYEAIFSETDPVYRILTLCIYEKYTYPPLFHSPEFLYRCICNFDLCNSEIQFAGYVKMLRKQSAMNWKSDIHTIRKEHECIRWYIHMTWYGNKTAFDMHMVMVEQLPWRHRSGHL